MNYRQIDRLVAEKVMGWATQEHKNIGAVSVYTEDEELSIPYNYCPTKRMEDAWNIVGKFFRVDIETGFGTSEHLVTIRGETGFTRAYAYAETVALAICIAALKTQGIEVDTN